MNHNNPTPHTAQKSAKASQQPVQEPIAIIGMSCRFPGGANSPRAFWNILTSGLDAIGDIPASRWDKQAFYDQDGAAPGKMHTMRGGFMDVAVDRFDPAFFNISPKEASTMDPQQRILLELSWEALEDACIDPGAIRGADTGVFIGVSSIDYSDISIHDNIDHVTSYSLTGSCHSALAGRISFVLGLEGPSLAIDTACSSSLVAIDTACAYLRLGRTGMALAGGFNLMLSPDMQICLTKLQALSPDGLCKSFDADANGYVRSEGGGLVVLKRLADALADGDRILGVIRGSAVNQDGESTGISAPNGKSQEKVILAALREAGAGADELDYLETHGTGTRVGDKTEITAIGNVMQPRREMAAPLLVGSVKSNIGHLEAASGIAGLQKVILAMQHGQIPGNLHFHTPSPAIDWQRFPLRVVAANTPWPAGGKPRLAGVSSFGFVGTNSHLVLQEPPAAQDDSALAPRPYNTLLLSARSPEALKNLIRRYIDFLKTVDDDQMTDICHAAAVGRRHFEFRAAVYGQGPDEFIDRLKELLENDTFPRSGKDQRLVFLYTGQGSQYYGMGRQLYQTQPVFRAALDECERLYREAEGASLLEVIHGEDVDPELVNNTRFAQPLIFAIEYALTQLWLSWGARPAATAGHSIGEYTAACMAGVFSLADALRLVALRGRLMDSVPGKGLMAAVFAPREEVEALVAPLAGRVSIAVLNTPDNTVIGGLAGDVEPLLEALRARDVQFQLLKVSHAFHSPQMDPILDEFRQAVSGITLHEPSLPLICNVTGQAALPGQLTDPEYWVRHLRGTVRMSDSLACLGREGYTAFLEIGPKPAMITFAKRCIELPRLALACSMKLRVPDLLTMAEAVGELYQAGLDLDWASYDRPFRARKVSLPTYPFSGQRHWVDSQTPALGATARGGSSVPASLVLHPLLGQRLETGALPGAVLFQMDILRGRHYFFAEHVIMGVETAPAAALLSWVWLAAGEVFPAEPFKLAEITLVQPLILYDEDRIGQIILRNVDAEHCSFEFLSRENRQEQGHEAEVWVTHCKGTILRGEQYIALAAHADQAPDPQELEARCGFQLTGEAFYESMAALGYTYGPLFRGIQSAASDGNDMLCHWLSPEKSAKTEGYWVTPSDLDIIFQSPAVALIARTGSAPDTSKIHIPFYIRGITFLQPLGPGRYSICTRSQATNEGGAQSVESTMYVRNDRQELCAVIDGFVSAAVSKQTLLREARLKQLNKLTYQEGWQQRPLPEPAPNAAGQARTWILFGEGSETGVGDEACDTLARHLAGHGAVHVVLPGQGLSDLGQGRLRMDWEQPQAYAELFEHLGLGAQGRVDVIHMPALRRSQAAAQDQQQGPGPLRSLLQLTQSLLAQSFPGRLYVVTAGNRLVQPEDFSPEMRNSGIEGFASVAQLEHPERHITHIDLSPFPEGDELASLAAEILADGPEMRLCLRRDQRLVARLAPWRTGEEKRSQGMPLPSEPYTLDTGDGGELDSMRLAPQSRRAPGPREVEFEVVASGLNFKDVLRALGELKDTANRIGGESAGVVTRVGCEVHDIRPGDAVISRDMAGGGFSSHQTVPRRFVTPKPESLSFEEAATVSIAYMTAHYGLFELGGLKKGERVLIHAGAGGVGMAAVQLALDAGAEVFSTAGSPRKRALLAEMGVHHVLNSRTLDFAERITELTQGQGVHLVLNALTGEFLRQSLLLLSTGGRFIELGKREILTREQVRAIHPTAVYQAFDLTDVVGEAEDGREDILREVFRKFDQGAFRPMPVQAFPIQKAPQAFRFMAQARHIGKLALSHRQALREPVMQEETPLRRDGAYVITGGLGGLGLQITARLAAHPVGTVVLLGRRQPDEQTLAKLKEMEASGTRIVTMQGDVANSADCARIFEQVARLPHRLRGVIHAAGVLLDRTIAQQDWDRFATVLAPKVQGSWNVHLATRDLLLDFFVLFSSASCTVGNMGQSNYAAANAYMNALALHRRALGLCATSICWGPWAEVGMAVSGNQAGLKMAQSGILGIKLAEGIAAMFGIIQKDLPVPTVLDMNWNVFLDTLPEATAATYFETFKAGRTRAAAQAPRQEEAEEQDNQIPPLQLIREAGAQDRLPLLMELLTKVVSRVMGYDGAATVATDISLTRMGLDSLMTMAFRNQLEKKLSIALPFALLSDNATLEGIAAHILGGLDK